VICVTCGVEVYGGDAHHFNAAGNVWHWDCDAPKVSPATPTVAAKAKPAKASKPLD